MDDIRRYFNTSGIRMYGMPVSYFAWQYFPSECLPKRSQDKDASEFTEGDFERTLRKVSRPVVSPSGKKSITK